MTQAEQDRVLIDIDKKVSLVLNNQESFDTRLESCERTLVALVEWRNKLLGAWGVILIAGAIVGAAIATFSFNLN